MFTTAKLAHGYEKVRHNVVCPIKKGVPQASWFTDPVKRRKETTFVFGDSAENILLKPLSYDSSNFLFLHVRDSGGLVEKYKEYSS